MRNIILRILVLVLLSGMGIQYAHSSTREERKLVSKGNKLYLDRKFIEAASIYEQALKVNPSSASAMYNLGLSSVRQISNLKDTTQKNAALIEKAKKAFTQVAQRAKNKPGIAAKANYNLGNMEFNAEQYQEAINYYKQALRIDPNDENARKNLRIAQKKLKDQQNNKDNKDQNKQDQNKQDQNKQDQNQKDQDKQNQQNQQDKKDQQNQPKDQEINQQTAERILQAMDNKENQTRARVNRARKGDKSGGAAQAVKRW